MSLVDQALIPAERIVDKLYIFRGQKVMLDRDLADLYGVPTKVLNQAVQRNIKRFPSDFMFKLTTEELKNSRSQFVTSSWGGVRYPPLAFTEQGVAMLSSVLNSERAILVNIQIIRTFARLREMIASHEDLRLKLEALERRYDEQFKIIFDAFRKMLEDENAKSQIGFKEI
ncbi:MAG: ORF6N domain-containing protein [Patescibacteria group bacterium]